MWTHGLRFLMKCEVKISKNKKTGPGLSSTVLLILFIFIQESRFWISMSLSCTQILHINHELKIPFYSFTFLCWNKFYFVTFTFKVVYNSFPKETTIMNNYICFIIFLLSRSKCLCDKWSQFVYIPICRTSSLVRCDLDDEEMCPTTNKFL